MALDWEEVGEWLFHDANWCMWEGSCSDWQCLLGTVLPWTWIYLNGQMPTDKNISGGHNLSSIFCSETGAGKLVPRAEFVDLDPPWWVRCTQGSTGNTSTQSSWTPRRKTSNNYARGHYTISKEFVDLALDWIWKLVDLCQGCGASSSSMALGQHRLCVCIFAHGMALSCLWQEGQAQICQTPRFPWPWRNLTTPSWPQNTGTFWLCLHDH